MRHSNEMWVIGDIHGARDSLVRIMKQHSIIDQEMHWLPGTACGVFVGDYVNKGVNGAGSVRLIRQLQQEAREDGAEIDALLGNHEILMHGMLLERQSMPYGEMASKWLMNGGRFLDLEAFERDAGIKDWLQQLPAMAKHGDTLFVHSDSVVYCELGASIEEVNRHVAHIMRAGDLEQIAHLFTQLSRRRELSEQANLDALLTTFGAKRVVHGHTPKLGSSPDITHNGQCINVEGGLWVGEEEDDSELGYIYWMRSV